MTTDISTLRPLSVAFFDYTNQQGETKPYIVLVTGVEDGDVLAIKLCSMKSSENYFDIRRALSTTRTASENFETVQTAVPAAREAFRRFKGYAIKNLAVL